MEKTILEGTGTSQILVPVDLDDEIKKSGIGKIDLLKLSFRSLGLRSIDDMPLIWESKISKVKPFGDSFRGYSLGLANGYNAYEAVSKAFGLATWSWGFNKYNLDYKTDIFTSRARLLGFEEPDTYRPVDNIVEQTQKYLDIITKENVPICFFVPQDYANHPSAKITKAEVDWYIQNPRRASNTYFIFGLFSAVNKAWYVNNRMNLIERVKAMAQAFKNIGVSRND